jgi:hypothetical protein
MDAITGVNNRLEHGTMVTYLIGMLMNSMIDFEAPSNSFERIA